MGEDDKISRVLGSSDLVLGNRGRNCGARRMERNLWGTLPDLTHVASQHCSRLPSVFLDVKGAVTSVLQFLLQYISFSKDGTPRKTTGRC